MTAALSLGFVLLLLGFLPLMGGPRYEAALLAGVLAPAWTLTAVAWKVRQSLCRMALDVGRDGLPRYRTGASIALEAVTQASMVALSILLVAVAHGVRLGPCEPLEGVALLILGPVVGSGFAGLLGGVWGVGSYFVLRKATRKSALLVALVAVSLPLASALQEIHAFYVTPTVYAFDVFAGYFAGPLYDAPEFELQRLLSFRVGTLGLCAFWAGLLCASSVSFSQRGPRWGLLRDARGTDRRVHHALGVGVFGLALSGVMISEGERMGHRGSAEWIRSELGRTTARKRCHVHFSRHLPAAVATRIARECEGHLNQLGRYFAVTPPARVDVYLFADDDQKRRLIGAGRTNVAKPWRREVYIRPEGVPHAILGHELAHVVAGEFGVGPFRVAGPLNGLILDPGRVEGFAEAAAVREASEGTLREWAAAMRQVGQLPPLRELFRLSFFGTSAARSYTAAGAFVEFLRETKGPDVLKRWYGGAPLGVAAGQSLKELETEFLGVLDSTAVPEEVLTLAKPRFSRPGVFERRCPHAVDRLVAQAHGLCGVQPQKAQRLFAEVVALDPERVGLELIAPKCDWLGSKQERAEQEYARLLSNEERFSPDERRGAWEDWGDLRWNAGRTKDARQAYENALALTFHRDGRRQLDAKLWGLSKGGLVEQALRALLAPSPEPDFLPAALLVRWQMNGPDEALAAYLLSRMALSSDRPEEAQYWADRYQPRELPLPSLQREGARTKLLIACNQALRSGAAEAFEQAYKTYSALQLNVAEKVEAQRWHERCLDPDAVK